MFANKYSSYKFRKRGVRGMKTQRIYRELTARGKVVCALAGVLEELLAFWVFGIRYFACSALLAGFVAVVLWFMFTVVTAAGMTGIDEVWRMLRGASGGAYEPAACKAELQVCDEALQVTKEDAVYAKAS